MDQILIPTLALLGLKSLGITDNSNTTGQNCSETYVVILGTLILVLLTFMVGFTLMSILAIYLSRGKLYGWIASTYMFFNTLAVSLLLAILGPEILQRWLRTPPFWGKKVGNLPIFGVFLGVKI